MDKVIVGLDGDTSAIDIKLAELQKKINSFRTGGAMEIGKMMGGGNKSNTDRMRQSQAEIFKRTQGQIDSELSKQLSKYKSITAEIDKQVAGSNKLKQLQQDEEVHLTSINRLKSQQTQMGLLQSAQAQGGPTTGMAGLKRLGNAFLGSGPGGVGGFGALHKSATRMGLGGLGGLGGMAGTALGFAGTAVAGGGKLASQIMTYPERQAQREATTAGMLGETARLQSQGRSYEMNLFGPERKKAMDRAGTRVTAAKTEDSTGIAGSALGMLGGAAMIAGGVGTMAAGAALAPFTGGASAAGGYMAGGAMIAGGAGLMGGSAYSVAGNDRKRSMVTDAVGLTEGNYETEMNAVFAKGYKENLELERAKSYEKDEASKFLSKNSERFTSLQRGMGLSDEDLWKGSNSIFQRAGNAGYGMNDMTQNMQGIMAGGGRASVAAAGGQVTAQMQRNMDLSNAPQLMGKVSGVTGGGVEESKDALIRMYAEATRIGLDSSEVRSFLQVTADMASQSGGSTDSISQMLAAGVGGLQTQRGIQSSASALGNIKNKTSEMGGLTGQYQLASMAKIKVIDSDGKERNLTMQEMAYLGGTDVTKLKNSKFIEGMDLEEGQGEILKKTLQKNKVEDTKRSTEQTTALDKFGKAKKLKEAALKESGLYVLSPQAQLEEKKRAEGKNVSGFKIARTQVMGKEAIANVNYPRDPQEQQISEMNIEEKLRSGEFTEADAAEARKMNKTSRGRLPDQLKEGGAKDDVGQFTRLTNNSGKLSTAFKTTTENTLKLGLAMDALVEFLDKVKSGENRESIRESFTKQMKDNLDRKQEESKIPVNPNPHGAVDSDSEFTGDISYFTGKK